MRSIPAAVVAAAAVAVTAVTLQLPAASALVTGPWSDPSQDPDSRAKALLAKMNMDEKLAMLHGPSDGPCCQCKTNATCAYVGNIVGNGRLDIPPVTMNDGPQGFRDNNAPGTTTAWPSGLTMAASWDVKAMNEWGEGMGREFYNKGSNVQLGPGLCLARVPRNGRNFEYLSGEDPFLGHELVQPVISGIQSQGVIANAKHYVLNNQETNRNAVSELATERVRYEMYYPPFAGAIEADVGSVMCSYNKINGIWSCENPVTLGHDLKETIGFKGFVMSDWGATHSTSIAAGLDVEMPSAKYMNPGAISAGIAAGNITQEQVDDSVFRILRAMFAVGVMDAPAGTWDWSKLKNNVTTEASVNSARHLSAVSTVLLKNDGGLLPLGQGKKIALIGFANDGSVVHGGGSGSVVPSYVATPREGITAAAGEAATITYDDGTDIGAAAKAAAAADYAIVFVGTLSHEGGDRASLSLDDGCDSCSGNAHNQNALVEAVAAAAGSKTIVVASVPGAVLMPWSGKVGAILVNFMPGQQAGNAIADVIFGSVNPSAKLPLTFPNKENETNFTPEQWPGLPNPKIPTYANYTEGLFVGYRYYDAHKIQFTTGFPFGHGLSYTEFSFGALSASSSGSSVQIKCTVTNSGSRPGAEVAQLYLGFPASAGEPPKVLRGFVKTQQLAAGESQSVVFDLQDHAFEVWSEKSHGWEGIKGEFQVFVGSSSRDIRQQTTVTR